MTITIEKFEITSLEHFYSFWDKQDHTKHTAEDFALRCIFVSFFKKETLGQTIGRLQRQFQPIHSFDKWGTGEYSGRSKYDTLRNVLATARSGWFLNTFKDVAISQQLRDMMLDVIQQLPEKERLTSADRVERKPKRPYNPEQKAA